MHFKTMRVIFNKQEYPMRMKVCKYPGKAIANFEIIKMFKKIQINLYHMLLVTYLVTFIYKNKIS